LVITDWSSIAQEFSLTTKKPSLFINTPMKVMNPEWQKIDVEPMDFKLRDEIGVSLDVDRLGELKTVANKLLENKEKYKAVISNIINKRLYNIGTTAKVGGDYIIERVLAGRGINE